jgi:hypothetical protein
MYINLGLVCFGALHGRGGTVAMAGPGANFYGMRLANGLFHVLNMFRDAATGDEAYNPGVLTGVVLIIPSGYLALRALRQDGILTSWGAARAMALGVFAHIPLHRALSKIKGEDWRSSICGMAVCRSNWVVVNCPS